MLFQFQTISFYTVFDYIHSVVARQHLADCMYYRSPRILRRYNITWQKNTLKKVLTIKIWIEYKYDCNVNEFTAPILVTHPPMWPVNSIFRLLYLKPAVDFHRLDFRFTLGTLNSLEVVYRWEGGFRIQSLRKLVRFQVKFFRFFIITEWVEV